MEPVSSTSKQQPIQSSERGRQPVLTTKNLSVVVFGTVLAVALWRANPEDIPTIVATLVGSQVWAITGWVLAVVILLASVVMIKLLIRFYDGELKRVTKERDDLQKALLERPR